MLSDLENMVKAAMQSCSTTLGAIGDLDRSGFLPPREARSLVYTALERLQVTQAILFAVDKALDMEERGHGSLRRR